MANKKTWEKVELSISDLKLWDENPRFPDEYFKKLEKDLIDYYLHDEKRFELRKFSREVVAEFDLPQVERLTIFDFKGEKIVLEGNRRIAVYKLLTTPTLAKEESDIELFEELRNKIIFPENYKVEANLTTSKEEGLRLVDRKHKKRNNEIGWGELERRNDSVRRSKGTLQDIRRVELGKLIRALSLPKEIIDKVLAKGYITTLYRIIDSEPARKKLDYKVLPDGRIFAKDENKFSNFLKVVVYNVYTKRKFGSKKNNVDSRWLNSTDAIRKYINSLSKNDVKNVQKAIESGQYMVRNDKSKKIKKQNSQLLPKCFVIMPLSGLDHVYKKIQNAWKDVFGKRASVIHQVDDSNKGAKELLDTKILKNIKDATIVVSVLSMGTKERKLYESIPEKDRSAVFNRVFPFNVNVALETGYAIRCMDDQQATLMECFLLADRSDKINAYDFAKNHFFDLAHRDIIAYNENDINKLETTLIRCFKEIKKTKRL